MPTLEAPRYYEHAKGDAANNYERSQFFKYLDPDFAVTDTGSVECPIGHVMLVEVTDEDVSRWVNGQIDGALHLDPDNVEAGWYNVVTDDNGLVWAMTYGTGTLAEEGARADFAEAEAIYDAWDTDDMIAVELDKRSVDGLDEHGNALGNRFNRL